MWLLHFTHDDQPEYIVFAEDDSIQNVKDNTVPGYKFYGKTEIEATTGTLESLPIDVNFVRSN